MIIQIPKTAQSILDTLPDAFIVGGFVRDSIMGTSPKDIDITTSATPSEIQEFYPDNIPIGKKFGTVIIRAGHMDIEVTTMRSDITCGRHPEVVFTKDLLSDLSRRDFTMNAMAYNSKAGLIDPYDAIIDIENKHIRAVGSPVMRMTEDPLRALRAIRFSSQLCFDITPSLKSAIRSTSLRYISSERIRDEFSKALLYNPVQTVENSIELGIMDQIIPDFEQLEDCPHDKKYHEDGNALQHTFNALSYTDFETVNEIWATLLHDYGKFFTKDDANPNHYYNHERVSGIVSEEVLRKLKFSSKDMAEILFSIKNHMKMHNITLMKKSKRYRLYANEHFKTLLTVHLADTVGRTNNLQFITEDIPEEHPTPLIDGRYLMSIGIEPSVRLGEIKQSLYDMQVEFDMTIHDLQTNALEFADIERKNNDN